jgi:hypothetical protein
MMHTGFSGATSSSAHRVMARLSRTSRGLNPQPRSQRPRGAAFAAVAMASRMGVRCRWGGMEQSTDTGANVVRLK